MKLPAPLLKVHAAGLLATAVLSLAGYYAIVTPAMGERDRAGALRAEVATQRGKAAQLAGTLTTLRDQYAEAKQDLSKHKLELLPVGSINQRLAEVGELAGACRLQVRSMQPEPATGEAHYETVPIRLAASGPFRACAEFIRRVHERYPDTGVATIALEGDPSLPDAPATFTITLIWHAAHDRAGGRP